MSNEEINNEFLTAVLRGNIDLAIECIEQGADINSKTTNGNNALSLALIKRKFEMFEWLLTLEKDGQKIDINNQNFFGETPFFLAVKEKNAIKYLKKLIEYRADPNVVNNDKMSPLIKAIADDKFDEIKAILEVDNLDINYQIPGSKTTAFLMATTVLKGSESREIIDLLIKKGADINALDSSGKNALINALFRSQEYLKKSERKELLEVCKSLIDIGLDLDYVAPSGMTAFWVVSLMKNPELAQMLMDRGVNTDVSHSIGLDKKMSALTLWLSTMGQLPIEQDFIEQMISLGAQLHTPNEDLNTPAAIGYANPYARGLMLELNADVNSIYYQEGEAKKLEKIPVIDLVIRGGDRAYNFVKEMIDRGAKVTYQNSKEEIIREPIFSAVSTNSHKIFKLLLETGQIDPNLTLKHSTLANKTKEDISLLSFIVSGSVDSRIASVLQEEDKIRLLLAAKEENEKNGIKSSIISDEKFAGMEEKLKSIEALKAEIINNYKIMFDDLVTYGADVNYQNNNGNTALFFANSIEQSKWLIQAGADIFIENNSGNNVLMNALMHGKTEVAGLFYELYKEKDPTLAEKLFYDLAFIENPSQLQRQNIEKTIYSLLDEKDIEQLFPKDKSIQPTKLSSIKEINYQDEDGNSPMLVACANDNPFLVSLYTKLGANVNLENNSGETPLMHAIAANNDRVVEFLIENGADIHAKTLEGKSVLEFALETENKKIIESIKMKMDLGIKEGQITGVRTLKPR